MQDYQVKNKYNGHALGFVRAASRQMAEALAKTIFGCYARVI